MATWTDFALEQAGKRAEERREQRKLDAAHRRERQLKRDEQRTATKIAAASAGDHPWLESSTMWIVVVVVILVLLLWGTWEHYSGGKSVVAQVQPTQPIVVQVQPPATQVAPAAPPAAAPATRQVPRTAPSQAPSSGDAKTTVHGTAVAPSGYTDHVMTEQRNADGSVSGIKSHEPTVTAGKTKWRCLADGTRLAPDAPAVPGQTGWCTD